MKENSIKCHFLRFKRSYISQQVLKTEKPLSVISAFPPVYRAMSSAPHPQTTRTVSSSKKHEIFFLKKKKKKKDKIDPPKTPHTCPIESFRNPFVNLFFIFPVVEMLTITGQ